MQKGFDFTGVTTVFFCHDGAGNFLMAKRNEKCRDEWGHWDIGGGGLKFGEQVSDALKREIFEEYCTNVLSFETLGFRDVHREHEGKKTHWVALDFKVLVDKDKADNGEPHKHDEIGWFTRDTMPDALHSQFPRFLELYGERLFEV